MSDQAEQMTVEQALDAIQDAPAVEELPSEGLETETPPEATEAQQEAPPAEQPKADKLEAIRKFQESARRERETREAELSRKQYDAKIKEADELLRLVKENPVAFVERTGLTYDDWARSLVNHKPKSPVDALQEQVSSLTKQIEAERQQQAIAQQVKAAEKVKNEIVEGIKSSSQFELVNALDMHDTVLDALQAHYDRTGEIRDVVEVAREVEEWLEALTAKAAGTSKVKSKLAPVVQAPRDGRTLTNAQAGAVPARTQSGLLSKEDSIAAAANLLRMQGE